MVRLHTIDIPKEMVERERAQHYLHLSPEKKWHQLLSLIATVQKLNNGEPLKRPQGKGFIITKRKAPNGSTE